MSETVFHSCSCGINCTIELPNHIHIYELRKYVDALKGCVVDEHNVNVGFDLNTFEKIINKLEAKVRSDD